MQNKNELDIAEITQKEQEALDHLAELRAKNDLIERMLNPKITLIKSRGFYTRHVRSRAERTKTRKAQKAARRNNR